jgi:hypothetical protein
MLKLYRLNPKVGTRKSISATSVKNEMYAATQDAKTTWKKFIPHSVAKIIDENWEIVKKFASAEDMTVRLAGMKFPKEGYNSK